MSILRLLSVCALAGMLPLTAASLFKARAGDSLQTYLNNALPGDVIELDAGATFTGNFVLRAKQGTGVITIRSSKAWALVNSRVSPSDAPNMAKIVTPNGSAAISTDPGASGYSLQGLEVAPATGVYPLALVYMGSWAATSITQQPTNITIWKCYIHGDPKVGGKNGIMLQTRQASVYGSYISDIKSTFQDSFGIGSFNGSGPFTILNNYVEAAGENIFFGGAAVAIPGLVPSDILIRGNTLHKPLRWRPGSPGYEGTAWLVKNHFELKNGQRVYFDGNILENCWVSGQSGHSIVLTVRTEGGKVPWAVVQDVYIVNNIVRHVGAGITGTAADDNGTGFGRRWYIGNNLFEDVNQATWGGGGAGWGINLIRNPVGVTFTHNTVFASRFAFYMSTLPASSFSFVNNIVTGQIGADGLGMNKDMAAKVTTLIKGNLFIGLPASSTPPGNNSTASIASVGFVNPAVSNYTLMPTSLWTNSGTDATNPGSWLIPTN